MTTSMRKARQKATKSSKIRSAGFGLALLNYLSLQALLLGAAYGKSVAEAPDREEVFRCRRIVLYLLAQPVDIYHDGVFVDYGLSPDNAVDHIFREDVVYVIDEEFHHGVLLGGERNLFVIFIEPQCRSVVLERSGCYYIARALRRCAATPPD